MERLESLGWTQDHAGGPLFVVNLAAEEALMNAIKHGHQLDARKVVIVTTCVSTSFFSMRIEDKGPGFNPEAVPDPTLEENLELPSGRGLMLMRTFMTRTAYNCTIELDLTAKRELVSA